MDMNDTDDAGNARRERNQRIRDELRLTNAKVAYAAIDKRYKSALARRDTREASVLALRRIRAAENLRRLEQEREA